MLGHAGRSRTSIRTASGTTQDQFLDRLRRLSDDPTLAAAVPYPPEAEPADLARLRSRLAAMKGGKAGFLARLDKGIQGIVAGSFELAQRAEATHLLDFKVDGVRRFYLPVGHRDKLATMGVQNHDEPMALLFAYVDQAQRGAWFFAAGSLWCTGKRGTPPPAWFDAVAARLGTTLAPAGATRGAAQDMRCPHAGTDGLRVRFGPEGSSLTCCLACSGGQLWPTLLPRVLGPEGVKAVAIDIVRADGGHLVPDERLVQRFRDARMDEAELVREAMAAWHASHQGAAASAPARWVLGSRDFGSDQAAFVQHLAPKPHEVEALRVATARGHAGPDASLADVLAAHPEAMPAALATLLGDGAEAFAANHADANPTELLRRAHEEAQRRQALASLPSVTTTGPVGAWLDAWARTCIVTPRREQVEQLRRDARKPPPGVGKAHIWALGVVLGVDSLEHSFDADQKHAGASLAPALAPLLAARQGAYVEALRGYLEASGSGETAH